MTERSKRILKYYPNIHLFKNVYLVRMYTYKARRLSFWTIYFAQEGEQE